MAERRQALVHLAISITGVILALIMSSLLTVILIEKYIIKQIKDDKVFFDRGVLYWNKIVMDL
jgi:hypothetical protein